MALASQSTAHFVTYDVLTSTPLERCATQLRCPPPSLTHIFRDAHPTSLALMRTDGPNGLRLALPGAEDIYARRWRTVADSGSMVACAEGVFECSE